MSLSLYNLRETNMLQIPGRKNLMTNGAFLRTIKVVIIALLILVVGTSFDILGVSAQTPVVHAVLFYSPTCGHCHKVITEDLPPLMEQYGDQLVILFVNVQDEVGGDLFLAAIDYFDIPLDHAGVPFLVVEEASLIGSAEIPERFPAIIEVGLASGGIDWPQIPELLEYLQESGLIESEVEQPTETVASGTLPTQNEPSDATGSNIDSQYQGTSPDEEQPNNSLGDIEIEPMTVKQRFLQDVVGNSISVLVLIGMVFVLSWVVMIATGRKEGRVAYSIGVIITLIVIGLIVSAYLSFVEITQETAVCGPVGDCNTVQQSEYATLFGIVPIGVLGIAGYLLILLGWFIQRWGPARLQRPAANILLIMTFSGTLFSIYLTYLEPFVIGATCAWCLTSAIVMTALLWGATQEGTTFRID
jgi:uncharacterized membrane protein